MIHKFKNIFIFNRKNLSPLLFLLYCWSNSELWWA